MNLEDKCQEECAVFGVSCENEEASGIVYNGLLTLQHRGQEGAGIAISSGNNIEVHKGLGLVSEVFSNNILQDFKSNTAIGHDRYSTSGNNTIKNVQPFISDYFYSRFAIVHNGNITNAKQLRMDLEKDNITFEASSDTEIISKLITKETLKYNGEILSGVINACKKLEGSFCLLILCPDNKIIAVRDKNGYRPLCMGKNANGIAVSSESCALDTSAFEFVRDIEPGEVVVIENSKITFSDKPFEKVKSSLCIFEHVYFARPDSIIDGQSVYQARQNMGAILAQEAPAQADIVSGVPDSGIEAGFGFSKESGIPYENVFVKNRYIGRSFIYPTQMQRENAVTLKMNPLKSNIEGKSIVLVDDSIVRGTTVKKIIRTLRLAGAKEIHMRISSPKFLHTCYYGTDIDSEENLIANKFDIEEMCKQIDADSLAFISLDGLKKACENSKLGFCTGCFDGNYGSDITKIQNISKTRLEK